MALGRTSRVTGWTLSIDESGSFDDPAASVCVVGVLLREAPSREADAILRGMLRRIDPIIPYPPHATDLRQIAHWVAAWALAAPPQRAAHPRRRLLDEAAARCERDADATALHAMMASLRAGQRPSYEALVTASRWLDRHASELAAQLRGLERDAEARYRLAVAAVIERFTPDGCFLVAAADRGSPAASSGDRYLDLLTALFERVFALLRARPAEAHEVWVVPAVRDVVSPPLGRHAMHPRDVGACVLRAERFPLDPPAGPADDHVRLIPAMPEAYGGATSPGVVLADFVANRSRQPLAEARPWPDLRDELLRRTGLSAEAVPRCSPGGAPMPAVAANGAPRDAVARAFREGVTEAADVALAPWPDGQAARWSSVAAALRPGGAR